MIVTQNRRCSLGCTVFCIHRIRSDKALLMMKQSKLSVYPSGITGQAPVCAYDTVTRDDKTYRIMSDSAPDRLCRHGTIEPSGKLPVGDGLTIGDSEEHIPYKFPEYRAFGIEFRHEIGGGA